MSEGKILSTIRNIITSSPYTIYQTSLLSFLVSGDIKYGIFFIVIIINEMLNHIEKAFFKKISEENTERPSAWGCKQGDCTTPIGCGIYPTKTYSTSSGFPSGHAQITSFAAMFWTLFLLAKRKKEKKPIDKYLIIKISILWILCFIVCYQRIYSECHSFIQVIAGLLFGIIFSSISYLGLSKIMENKFPKLF